MKRKIFVSVLVSIALVSGCAKKEAPEKIEKQKPENAAEQETDVSLKQKVLSFSLEGLSEKGAKKWEVKGESADVVSQNEIRLLNIVAKAYGEEAEATLTADKGIYDKSKNNVKLEENVKVKIDTAQNLSEGHMDIAGQIIGIPGAKGPNPAKGEKNETTITCNGEAVFNYEKNMIYFDNGVKVHSADGDIDADRITINLDMETKKIKDIVAEGNVKITRGENITYSDKAIYNEAEKKIILSGRPRLIMYHEGDIGKELLE